MLVFIVLFCFCNSLPIYSSWLIIYCLHVMVNKAVCNYASIVAFIAEYIFCVF